MNWLKKADKTTLGSPNVKKKKEKHPVHYLQSYDQDHTPYYVNMISGDSMWSLPYGTPVSDVLFITHLNEEGVPYYENVKTGETSWQLPVDEMSPAARRNSTALKKMTRRQSETFMNATFDKDESARQMKELDDYCDEVILEVSTYYMRCVVIGLVY